MTDSHSDSADRRAGSHTQAPDDRDSAERQSGMSKSMHDGVAVWCDCCSCEAEPYWAALAGDSATEADGDAGQRDGQGPSRR